MAQHQLALVNGSVLLPDGSIDRVNIGVLDGKIATLTSSTIDAEETLDVGGLTVLPGLIDEHFHVFHGYPWETYANATRSAAKGGITTIVDMPLDKPPTLTSGALEEKLAVMRAECFVDYAAFGGYLNEDPDALDGMLAAGVVAIKLFTGGVAPPGMYPGVDAGQILDAMRRAARAGATIVVHCENAPIVDHETARLQREGRTDPGAWDEARPWFAETEAVQRVALLAEVTGARTVIAHISSPQSARAVREARARGADVWAETCPHYLCVTKEQMAQNPRFKWNPPSRDGALVDELWELVRSGDIHTIGTDHATLPKAPDANVWDQSPGSGNALETMLPVVATEAERRGIGLSRVVELLSSTPARVFGLYPRKGTIAIGSDADFAVVETARRQVVDATALGYLEGTERWSPFDGYEVSYFPVYTVLRGAVVFREGELVGSEGQGAFLARETVPG